MGRRTLLIKRRGYKRKPYRRKDGIKVRGAVVPATRARIIDRGKPGLTPKSQQFYHPKVKTGWHATDSEKARRGKALRAHHGDVLATGRGLLALANVNHRTNPKVSRIARKDADYFFGRLR
jgi:hypothetical protein